MEFADKSKANAGDVRVIAVAYFFGTVISIWLLSAIGVPMPTTPADASRDQVVILGLIGAFALALAVFPLTRGVGGPPLRRLSILFAFTYVSFAVINQLQATFFTTIGGTDLLVFVYGIPCLLAAGAAVWLVPPVEGSVTRHKAFWQQPVKTWWWRPILSLLALPGIEVIAGMATQPVLEKAIRLESSGVLIPSGATVIGSMFLKSALLLAVTMPIVLVWTKSRRSLVLALGFAMFVLTGLVGLIQATWWPVSMRFVFSLHILVTSITYAAVVVLLFMPKGEKSAAELETSNQ